LKRFVTDRIDPAVYKPVRKNSYNGKTTKVAVVGSGPAGLAAAHYLSLLGLKVTLIEAEDKPGGMLISCIPAYRLPHDTVSREIESLLDENVTLRCSTRLGRDVTIDGLFDDDFKAVFLAMGADKSWRLDLEGENVKGVYPSMQFLKAFNLMPAYAEEVEAAIEEGITLETLVSPVKIRYIEAAEAEGITVETFVSPIKIDAKHGHLADIRCIRNKLGEMDSSGRRKPIPIPGSEFTIALDTMIVAIGERPDSECLAPMGLNVGKSGRLHIDTETLSTNRSGVFAGGDLVTGPNTVVDAIAAGKKAAEVIDRYLQGKELRVPIKITLPKFFIEPPVIGDEELEEAERVEPATLPVGSRRKNFAEVEMSLSVDQATREARRCLRCDLEFTRPMNDNKTEPAAAIEEKSI